MWMCLLIHFVLKNGNCKYYVSIFYKIWVVGFWTWWLHITQNVKYNSVTLLLGYNQVFFHPEVLNFLPIYFPHILSVSGKPYLLSWERLDSSIFVCTSKGQKSRGRYAHGHAIWNRQYTCMALVLCSETCRTAAYSNLHKKHILWLHVTDKCIEQFFVCIPTLLRMLMN